MSMDVGLLFRLKGLAEAGATPDRRPGQAEGEAWPRVRAQALQAVANEQELRREFEQLFPAELSTKGRVWGAQGAEAVTLLRQLAGWLGGLIDAATLQQRIQADAEARAKQTGFR